MKRLERLELFGRGLVAVSSPKLVARYNETLAALGIAPTELERFHVDGMGWSPEIAAEKGERYYLSPGMACPLAIIVRPEQRGKPIYTPFASYDRHLMKAYFDRFRPEIADITRDAALWLDIDRQLSRFQSPLDLLLVDYVTIRSHAGRLSDAECEQRRLVKRFETEKLGWLDAKLRRRIVESAKNHGDLRFRRLHVPDVRFDDVKTFYTGLFGGLFVFRDLPFRSQLLVMQDPEEFKQFEDRRKGLWSLEDSYLFRKLLSEEIIELDMSWYRDHPEILREKMEYLALDAICGADPEIDFGASSGPERARRIQALGDAVPDVYFELERLIVELEREGAPKRRPSDELSRLLYHPHQRFTPGGMEHEVVWQLLCRISPLDVMRLYLADKESFFEASKTWPESKKRWVAQRIAERYRPKMDLWHDGGST